MSAAVATSFSAAIYVWEIYKTLGGPLSPPQALFVSVGNMFPEETNAHTYWKSETKLGYMVERLLLLHVQELQECCWKWHRVSIRGVGVSAIAVSLNRSALVLLPKPNSIGGHMKNTTIYEDMTPNST